mgnify:FL=1
MQQRSTDLATVVQPRSIDPVDQAQSVMHQAFTERAPVASSLRLNRLDGRLLNILRRSRDLSTERRKDNLEMRRRGLVGVNTSVCPVGAAAEKDEKRTKKAKKSARRRFLAFPPDMDVPHLRGLLADDVLDKELVLVEAVDLGVGLGVLDEREQELGRPGENNPLDQRSASLVRTVRTVLCLCSSRVCARETHLTGQRPWTTPWILAWAVRPTAPLWRRNGTHWVWVWTSSKNLTALASERPRTAAAVSLQG